MKKKFNYGILFLLIFVMTAGMLLSGCGDKNKTDDGDSSSPAIEGAMEAPEIPILMQEDGQTPTSSKSTISGAEHLYEDTYIITNGNDYTCLVNKTYNLPEGYEPYDLVPVTAEFAQGRSDEVKYLRTDANDAVTEMVNAAAASGHKIYPASGYRSYSVQKYLFQGRIAQNGGVDGANVYTALPGQSEHQLGLAMDFALARDGYSLSFDFGKTDEGVWMEENCWKYGFILRYPQNKEDITGYGYEPWHFRYVGVELAKYLYDNDLALEEYYGVPEKASEVTKAESE